MARTPAFALAPTDRHASILGRQLIDAGGGGNLVRDAHLATIAIEHGATLGTFDRDFERFPGLRCEFLDAATIHEHRLRQP